MMLIKVIDCFEHLRQMIPNSCICLNQPYLEISAFETLCTKENNLEEASFLLYHP